MDNKDTALQIENVYNLFSSLVHFIHSFFVNFFLLFYLRIYCKVFLLIPSLTITDFSKRFKEISKRNSNMLKETALQNFQTNQVEDAA
jgi:predicted PurR-regulated permease PerM